MNAYNLIKEVDCQIFQKEILNAQVLDCLETIGRIGELCTIILNKIQNLCS